MARIKSIKETDIFEIVELFYFSPIDTEYARLESIVLKNTLTNTVYLPTEEVIVLRNDLLESPHFRI